MKAKNVKVVRLGMLLVLGLLALCLPVMLNEYYVHIFVIAFYYVILATSWNLLSGFTGRFSLAHAAFAGMGAYTSALLAINFGIPVCFSIILGGIGAAAFGLILGFLSLRARGIYLGVATWAFAETFRIVVSIMYKVTRGDLGLSTPHLLGTSKPTPHYYLFLALAIAAVGLVALIMHSRVGFFFRSIRDDEVVARAMGIHTVRWKILAFCISSAMAGIAGATYGHYIGLISPAMIQWYEMVTIIIMVVVGGMGTLAGPVIGAIAIQLLSEVLRPIGAYRMVMFALIVIVLMRVYNKGVMGLVKQISARFFSQVPLPETEEEASMVKDDEGGTR